MSNIVSIVNGEALTTTLAISEGVGYEHKTVIQLVRQYLSDLQEFGRVAFENAAFKTNGGVQSREIALLNEDQATLLITYMRNNDVVRMFKKTLVRAFRDMRNSSHTLPQSFSEALQLAANLEKQREVACLERDKAIATKAEIGAKREATAMARASAEKRRADKLEQKLGDNTNWKAAKAIDWIPVVFDVSIPAAWSQIGKYLKRLSDELGYEFKEVEHSAFNKVKSYHIDVITEAYKRIKKDRELLAKYRKIKKVA